MARESYDATIISSDAEEAADVHGDAVCENALEYAVVPSVSGAYTKSVSTCELHINPHAYPPVQFHS